MQIARTSAAPYASLALRCFVASRAWRSRGRPPLQCEPSKLVPPCVLSHFTAVQHLVVDAYGDVAASDVASSMQALTRLELHRNHDYYGELRSERSWTRPRGRATLAQLTRLRHLLVRGAPALGGIHGLDLASLTQLTRVGVQT